MATAKIDNNKKYFQSILDSLPDPVIIIRRDFTVCHMNQTAEAKAVRHGHLVGDKHYCYELLHGKNSTCSAADDPCPMGEVFRTGKPSKSHHRHQGPTAETVVEVTCSPIFGEHGEVVEVVEIVRDVTAGEIVKRLIASEQRFRGLVESAPDAIMNVDASGTITYVNASTTRMFGHTAAELIGKSVNVLMPEKFHGVHTNAISRAAGSSECEQTGKTLELTALRKDGSEFPIEFSLSSRREEGDVCFIAMIRDITERRQTEQLLEVRHQARLKEHEEMARIFKLVEIGKREWEKTMDCVGDMVILLDNDDKVKRCNRSFRDFVQKTYDQILGNDGMELFMDQGIQLRKFYNQRIEVFCQPTGRWFIINWYPVTGIIGDQVSGTVIVIHDTTDLKEVTDKLEQTNRVIEENRKSLQDALNELSSLIQRVEKEQTFDIRLRNPNLRKCYSGVYKSAASNSIYQIGEQFNNMMNILELKNTELQHAYEELQLTQAKVLQQEKMASIGQLAAGVAHEINNPMGFISSNLGTLDKYVARIVDYARILTEMVEELKDTRLIETIQGVRKKQKIDFIIDDAKKLIKESLDGAERVKIIVQNLKSFSRVDQGQAMDADINECIETTLNIVWNELKYKATVKKEYGALPLTWCYPQQLNQVFMNLLVNAAQAMEKQGEITIRTWHQNGEVFASVADTGMGIPEKNLTRIFEPFFTTKEVGKGTGLGLSITYDIVKKHNGEITVQSEVGKGTTFTVRLPVSKDRNPSKEKETL